MSTPEQNEVRQNLLSELSEMGASERLMSEFQVMKDEELADFVNAVDESSYSAREWLETLIAFEEWESENDRDLALYQKIEYLQCCVQGTSNEGRLMTLKSVWENYIQNYGVES